MNARDLIPLGYTSDALDAHFPQLTYEERLPFFEYEIIEAARTILVARGFQETAGQLADCQKTMEGTFSRFLDTIPTDREMIRTPADVGAYYECETFEEAQRVVAKYGDESALLLYGEDGRLLSGDALDAVTIGVGCDTSEFESVTFTRTLHFPFTGEQYSEAWSAVEAEREAYLSESFRRSCNAG